MEQLELAAPANATREYTLLLVRASDRYRPDFHQWLTDNWGIWLKFREQADIVRRRGRKHYAARTIVEWMRHETTLRELGEFKINDHATPDLARLYMALDPSAEGFFALRGRE